MEDYSIVGYISIVAGLAIALLASRLPMNTLVGFRVGPAFTSRRLWIRYNRVMGIVLVAAGIVSVVAAPRLGEYTTLLYISMVMVAYLALVAASWRDAAREATFRPPTPMPGRSVDPIRPGLYRLLLALVLAAAPLPGAGWDPARALPFSLPGMVALGLCIAARVEPILFYNPWISHDKMFSILYEISLAAGAVAAIALYTPEDLAAALSVGVGVYAVARMLRVMKTPTPPGAS